MDGLGIRMVGVQGPLRLTVRTSSAPFWIIRSMESLTNVLAVNRERRKFISSSPPGYEECEADLESISRQ